MKKTRRSRIGRLVSDYSRSDTAADERWLPVAALGSRMRAREGVRHGLRHM